MRAWLLWSGVAFLASCAKEEPASGPPSAPAGLSATDRDDLDALIAFSTPKGIVDERHRKIFLNRAHLREITKHASSEMSREIGGMLVGWSNAGFTKITRTIPARGVGTADSFTFSPEAIAEIVSQLRGSAIVGWYHSHPGQGIFLSGTDVKTHQAHFSGPGTVALVVDPKAGTLGLFQSGGDSLVPCGFYLLPDKE